jgi:SPP1 gp7 family putative phage head morphogenesis protein
VARKQSERLIDVQCEACARELESMYLLVTNSDELVAKALVLSEVAQIAKAEARYQELLTATWRHRAKQAELRAGMVARKGKSKSAVTAEVRDVMKRWQTDVYRPARAAMKRIYKLARTAAHKKATGQSSLSLQYSSAMLRQLDVAKAKPKDDEATLEPSFDLVDEKTIRALQEEQLIWIGRHYDANVGATVREAIAEIVTTGMGRREAALAMMKAVNESLTHIGRPGGFQGTDKQYFEGLAANAATNARVLGQLRSFASIGITKYELVNPMDHRTSEICAHLNGKVFTVADAADQVSAMLAADTPEEYKEAHPWLTYKEILDISPKSGQVSAEDSQALAEAGVLLPPFHWKCRTTVDISQESLTFDQLED